MPRCPSFFCSMQGQLGQEINVSGLICRVFLLVLVVLLFVLFKLMGQNDGFEALSKCGEAFVQSSFVAATKNLKTRVRYIWSRVEDNRILSGYKVGSLSRYLQ